MVYYLNLFIDTSQDGMWQWSDGTKMSQQSYTNYANNGPTNRVNTPDCFQIFTGISLCKP